MNLSTRCCICSFTCSVATSTGSPVTFTWVRTVAIEITIGGTRSVCPDASTLENSCLSNPSAVTESLKGPGGTFAKENSPLYPDMACCEKELPSEVRCTTAPATTDPPRSKTVPVTIPGLAAACDTSCCGSCGVMLALDPEELPIEILSGKLPV